MNRLCTLLGIERPVIQAPMAGVQGLELAAAGPQPRPTALTAACTGRPARGLVNRWIEDSARVASAIPAFPLAAGAVAPLRAAAEAQGRDDFTALWAGEHVHAPRPGPAAALVEALAAGRPTQEATAP